MPGPNRKIVIDVSIACPIPIFGVVANRQFSRQKAMTVERAADERYNAKLRIYDAIASSNGLKFQPIIFESSGRMHSQSLKFVKSIIGKASMNGDGHLDSVLCNYWLSRISCSFQHQIAAEILGKIRKLKGSDTTAYHYENSDTFVADFAYRA